MRRWVPSQGLGAGVAVSPARPVWIVVFLLDLAASQAAVAMCSGAFATTPVSCAGGCGLGDVAAVSSSDVWAVGWQAALGQDSRTLRMHWDGTVWSPAAGSDGVNPASHLNGLAAISTDDVWAVGYSYIPGLGYSDQLIEHWDGNSWREVLGPLLPAGISELYGVAATAPDDVWAVGLLLPGISDWAPLIEHWDGTEWSVVPAAPPDGRETLWAVVAIARDDAWLAGSAGPQHWDGTSWSRVPFPPDCQINAFAALSSDDVWAVGFRFSTGPIATCTAHWDGAAWTVVPSPNRGTSSGLWGVAALCPGDVRAVGIVDDTTTLILRWDGSDWCAEDGPNPGLEFNRLGAAAAVPGGGLWTVGAWRDLPGSTSALAVHAGWAPGPVIGNALRAVRVGDSGTFLDWSGRFSPRAYNVHHETDKRRLPALASLPPLAQVDGRESYESTAPAGEDLVFYRVFGRDCGGSSTPD